MRNVSPLVRVGQEALQRFNLLKALQSEIQDELSSNRFQESRSSSLRNFVVDWDSPQSQDVVLRRKFKTGEEVAVSALLAPLYLDTSEGDESLYPRDVLMKVCLKKPGLSSFLQFDCIIYENDGIGSEYNIQSACYLQSPADIGPSVYRGPSFSTLDDKLQVALKEFLVAKGIGENLTKFLLLHLHKKEQGQYVNWLQKLELFVAKQE